MDENFLIMLIMTVILALIIIPIIFILRLPSIEKDEKKGIKNKPLKLIQFVHLLIITILFLFFGIALPHVKGLLYYLAANVVFFILGMIRYKTKVIPIIITLVFLVSMYFIPLYRHRGHSHETVEGKYTYIKERDGSVTKFPLETITYHTIYYNCYNIKISENRDPFDD